MEHRIDERLVHRLEAFSDIVIALSLSEIAFNLTVPANGHGMAGHPLYLVGFLGGFAFVASIWWIHSRIFAKYFVPDTLGIIGNFALLAATVLFAWAQQLMYRSGFDLTTIIAYAATGGAVYVLLGLLYVRGARDGRLSLLPADRAAGFGRGIRIFVVGAILLLSIALAPFGADVITYAWLLLVPAVLILRRVLGPPRLL